jgi:UDP-N-acetylmuramoyl-L-alanyl-D-glutamate--2,6-diaminopimelate ligase
MMGAIAAELADDLVITDDNPRTEAPEAIVAHIAAGIPAGKPYRIEHDRGRAIRDALLDAAEHDVVLVAGKGHEDYQIYGRERRVFSDQKTVSAALTQRGSLAGPGGAA